MKEKSEQPFVPSEDAISVLLAEYQSLRTELDHYSQRIDRVAGVYITAMFAVIGFLLRPGSTLDLGAYLNGLLQSDSAIFLLLCIPILNSLLLIRSLYFYLALLSISQYTHYEIRPKINKLAKGDYLNWDREPIFHAKREWVPIRGLGQSLFSIVAEALSIAVLLFAFHASYRSFSLGAMYAVSLIFVILSVYSIVKVSVAGKHFHEPDYEKKATAE